jgi:hypothetical protein
LLGVSILLFALTATHSRQEAPVLRASTAKSLNEFGTCFADRQQRNSQAWAFMPTESGGTFTNAGANGAAATYWVTFQESPAKNEVRIVANRRSADLVQAVMRCR